MAKVNLVSKKVQMTLTDIIKYQLITYCYINKITLNESDLTCLTLLGVSGKYNLTDFCMFASQQNIFKNPQSVRNCLVKLEKHDLIQKERKNKKIISLSSDINVQVTGNIVLDYKIIHLATT
jgi:hypothetical protein